MANNGGGARPKTPPTGGTTTGNFNDLKTKWDQASGQKKAAEYDAQRDSAREMTYQEIVALRHRSGMTVADLVQCYSGNGKVQPWEQFMMRIINRERKFGEFAEACTVSSELLREQLGLRGEEGSPLVTTVMTDFLSRIARLGAPGKRAFL
ncbi:unnamed protein product, partial [Heterosigma akashiwo]